MYRAKKNRAALSCPLIEADSSPAPSDPAQPMAASGV